MGGPSQQDGLREHGMSSPLTDRRCPATPLQPLTAEATHSLSFVIPAYNERETLEALHDRITTNAAALTDQ